MSMLIRRELSMGFVVKTHVSYDVSVIWNEVRNSKPSVKVNLCDGYQISIKPRDELYLSVLTTHEQVRSPIKREVAVLSERVFSKSFECQRLASTML